MKSSNNMKNKTLSDRHILKSSASMYSVYTYISLDPQQEYNQDQTPLMNQGLVRPF